MGRCTGSLGRPNFRGWNRFTTSEPTGGDHTEAPTQASWPPSEGLEPSGPASAAGTPRRLLDRVRDAIRLRHYSVRTEDTYVDWARRFILFHGKRHPESTGAADVEAFLTHLAIERGVAAATQNQAKSALRAAVAG